MVLVNQRTRPKQRIQAILAKYGLSVGEVIDLFGVEGRRLLWEKLATSSSPDSVCHPSPAFPNRGLGKGDRGHRGEDEGGSFSHAGSGACGFLTGSGFHPGHGDRPGGGGCGEVSPAGEPRLLCGVSTPGLVKWGEVRYGKTRPDVNRYLKWAYIEAANVISCHASREPYRHMAQLYLRLKERKGHRKAMVAVGRHLAEAAWWVLKTERPYQKPTLCRLKGGMGA